MSKFLKICWDDGAIGGWIAFLTAIGIIIYSAICPPKGIIDGSILWATSELLAFAVVFKIPNMIKSIKDGKSLHIHHKDTDVEINSDKPCDCQKDNSTDENRTI